MGSYLKSIIGTIPTTTNVRQTVLKPELSNFSPLFPDQKNVSSKRIKLAQPAHHSRAPPAFCSSSAPHAVQLRIQLLFCPVEGGRAAGRG